jgi:hypothetical protein
MDASPAGDELHLIEIMTVRIAHLWLAIIRLKRTGFEGVY